MSTNNLNYHHLHYFWMVAHEGSIGRACERLHVSQPTISAQIRALERSVGGPLFERLGRRNVLTDLGKYIVGYCDDIFALGRELETSLQHHGSTRRSRTAIGISDHVPKLIAYRLLKPLLMPTSTMHLRVLEGSHQHMCTALVTHDVDLVISETPLDDRLPIQAHCRLLGESPVALFAARSKAGRLRRSFPQSLNAQAMLVHDTTTRVRRDLDEWFHARQIRPHIVGEFQDSALMKACGQAGAGVFPGPEAIAGEICRQYQVQRLGVCEGVVERFYLISLERRIRNPAIQAVMNSAHRVLLTP